MKSADQSRPSPPAFASWKTATEPRSLHCPLGTSSPRICCLRRSRHVPVEIARRMSVFELNCSVMNVELARKQLTDSLSDPLRFRGGHVQRLHVAGERVCFGAKAPDVDVMHFA